MTTVGGNEKNPTVSRDASAATMGSPCGSSRNRRAVGFRGEARLKSGHALDIMPSAGGGVNESREQSARAALETKSSVARKESPSRRRRDKAPAQRLRLVDPRGYLFDDPHCRRNKASAQRLGPTRNLNEGTNEYRSQRQSVCTALETEVDAERTDATELVAETKRLHSA